jgi:acetyltransferase-like isoleucine patch superfamily enzyme
MYSQIIPRLMFDYEHLTPGEVEGMCKGMPLKMIRWIAINHPDNRSRLQYYRLSNVPMGDDCVINAGVTLYDEYQGLIRFGHRVAVATGVTIVASSNPNNSQLSHILYVSQDLIKLEPVVIEDDAWLGTQAVILPGITVGKGAIVGAGAVVLHDVPAYTVVCGTPARPVRQLQHPSITQGSQ